MDQFLGTKLNIEQKEKINLSILYAEDNKIVRESVIELLELRYKVVESVSNGQELMNKLLTPGTSFDCVVTDNNMPLKTGRQVLIEIRKNDRLKNLPVIVLTGDDDEIREEVESLGAVCMGKPPDFNNLFEVIEERAKKKK